ncbi:MAG: hypothetical protein AAGL89_00810 [Pseudomonadota bacterium]
MTGVGRFLAVGLALGASATSACGIDLIESPGWTRTAWSETESRLNVAIIWRGDRPFQRLDGSISISNPEGEVLGSFDFVENSLTPPSYSFRVEGRFLGEAVPEIEALSAEQSNVSICLSRVVWDSGEETVLQ